MPPSLPTPLSLNNKSLRLYSTLNSRQKARSSLLWEPRGHVPEFQNAIIPDERRGSIELRLRLDEGRRRPAVQDRVHIVQGQHAHCCPGLDRGAADMRQ
jgi:hypothetical protein